MAQIAAPGEKFGNDENNEEERQRKRRTTCETRPVSGALIPGEEMGGETNVVDYV